MPTKRIKRTLSGWGAVLRLYLPGSAPSINDLLQSTLLHSMITVERLAALHDTNPAAILHLLHSASKGPEPLVRLHGNPWRAHPMTRCYMLTNAGRRELEHQSISDARRSTNRAANWTRRLRCANVANPVVTVLLWLWLISVTTIILSACWNRPGDGLSMLCVATCTTVVTIWPPAMKGRRKTTATNAVSFRAIVVTSDGLIQDKSPRDIGEIWSMAMSFGCSVTYIQVSEKPSPGIYSFMVMPTTRLSCASEREDPQTGFLAWLGEAVDPRTSPIRYAEVLFDGDRESTVLERHHADGLRDERLATLNIPRG